MSSRKSLLAWVLVLAAMSIGLAPQTAAAATPRVLSASSDTSFRANAPEAGYGKATRLRASPYRWKAFVRFPTAQIDDGATIASATLRLYGTTTSRSRWKVHAASSAWSERSTHSTMPTWNRTVLGTSAASVEARSWNDISIPVSSIDTSSDTSFGIRGTTRGSRIGFHSRENRRPPRLVLTYADSSVPDTAPPTTTITSGPAASGSATSATFAFTSNEPGTFACSLDGAAYVGCTSPRTVSGLAVGAHSMRVRATDAAGNVDPTPASHSWEVTAPTSGTAQPKGPPGDWTIAFADEFNGTSLDRTKWSPNWFGDGGRMNNVGTYASNVSVADGELRLQLDSVNGTVRGALVHTDYGTGRYQLPVGGVAEARVRFAGDSNQDIYNWPAWWASGPSWPSAGEHDIAEGLGGSLTVNYHGTSNSKNFGTPSGGPWGNAFHVFTVHRKVSTADVYWNGRLVRSYPTGDNGRPQELILNVGRSSSRTPVLGSAGAMRVDYVRAWRPKS